MRYIWFICILFYVLTQSYTVLGIFLSNVYRSRRACPGTVGRVDFGKRATVRPLKRVCICFALKTVIFTQEQGGKS
jgi:hypothetical protein